MIPEAAVEAALGALHLTLGYVLLVNAIATLLATRKKDS